MGLFERLREKRATGEPGVTTPEVAAGDDVLRLSPGSHVRLNSISAWSVGPRCRSMRHAQLDAEMRAAEHNAMGPILDALATARNLSARVARRADRAIDDTADRLAALAEIEVWAGEVRAILDRLDASQADTTGTV